MVGQSYHNTYWRQDYAVLAVAGSRVTVKWEDGRTVTHMTAFDPRCDKPFHGVCPLGDQQHGDALRNRANNWGGAR
ncbi:hypothetical protein AWB91_09050 [Mycobacterium paraense]|uniref:Transposase-like Mu C-terminal domain-containing protein n=1 Tax=Mycobacterium paraense TaxID=767916 RepID=A0ABX3VSB6_9MYCO|nr:hypothetical protein AWB91_09050 [Mycobacterium paraense]